MEERIDQTEILPYACQSVVAPVPVAFRPNSIRSGHLEPPISEQTKPLNVSQGGL